MIVASPVRNGESKTSSFIAGIAVGLSLWVLLKLLGVWSIVPPDEPFGPIVAGVVGGIVWQWPIGRRWLSALACVVGIVMLVVTVTPLTRVLVASLIRQDTMSLQPADAVVVLGAGVTDVGLLNAEGVDRMVSGARLIREGKAATILLSRPAESLRRGKRPDGDWARFLALLPTPPVVEVLDSTETTHHEALRAAQLARERGWRRLLVVTSPLHTRRACAAFERAGLVVICVPSESRDIPLPAPASATDRLAAFAMWLHEAIGWEVYRLRGWV